MVKHFLTARAFHRL